MIKQIKFKLIFLLALLCLPRGVVAACETACAGGALCGLCCLISACHAGFETPMALDAQSRRQQDFIENGERSRYRPVPKCCLCRLPGECVCCFSGCWCERQDSGEEKCVDCEFPFDVCCDVCSNYANKWNSKRNDALRRCCGRTCCPCLRKPSDKAVPLISDRDGAFEMVPINVVPHFVQPPGVIAAAR